MYTGDSDGGTQKDDYLAQSKTSVRQCKEALTRIVELLQL